MALATEAGGTQRKVQRGVASDPGRRPVAAPSAVAVQRAAAAWEAARGGEEGGGGWNGGACDVC